MKIAAQRVSVATPFGASVGSSSVDYTPVVAPWYGSRDVVSP